MLSVAIDFVTAIDEAIYKRNMAPAARAPANGAAVLMAPAPVEVAAPAAAEVALEAALDAREAADEAPLEAALAAEEATLRIQSVMGGGGNHLCRVITLRHR